MKAKNTTKLTSTDFKNPFNGRNAEEVWKEINERSKPITKEELFKRIEELKNKFE